MSFHYLASSTVTPKSFGLLKPNIFTKVKSNTFVAVIAVNIEANVPNANVTAKPFIGPVPNTNKIVVIIKVVKFESNIAIKPLLKPESIEFLMLFPNLNSSFILSKIITLASTAIPSERINPAIPGKVSVASIKFKQANVINPNKIIAKSAIIPGNL